MPDAFVFPGGAVDLGDRELASSAQMRLTAGSVAPELAAAALRELFEEAGILLVRDAGGNSVSHAAADLAALRAELADGKAFAALLRDHGLALDADALAYYSNWITPESEPIRFDTHFFIARAPDGQNAAADAVEVHDGVWLAPRDALAAAARSEMTIPFPTLRHLERLARHDDIEALMAHARTRVVVPVMPAVRDDGTFEYDDAAW